MSAFANGILGVHAATYIFTQQWQKSSNVGITWLKYKIVISVFVIYMENIIFLPGVRNRLIIILKKFQVFQYSNRFSANQLTVQNPQNCEPQNDKLWINKENH